MMAPVYRQNRPERVCEALLRLAAGESPTPEQAGRRLYAQFGVPPETLLAELSAEQRRRLMQGLRRRGCPALAEWMEKEWNRDGGQSADCDERRCGQLGGGGDDAGAGL